jgi:hypothetical protein
MFQLFFLRNKSILLWLLLSGFLVAGFSIAPQIDLWVTKGEKWNGIYAINDLDEPFYAAYAQSLIDGKPRRNSPVSGVEDGFQTPQKESYLSIQFFASYPLAIIVKLFGISISNAMILLSLIAGFLSALTLYWLFYLFSQNAAVAFVGTVSVLFGGAIAAGQGSVIQMFFPESIHFPHSLIFLRRSVPAIGFPSLFLFFIFVFKTLTSEKKNTGLWLILSGACFTFTVYSYFYFWTTALAWICILTTLWTLFHFEEIQKYKKHLLLLLLGIIGSLIPYFILASNRSIDVDSALSLSMTHEPDLWRIPELLSYLAIALILLAVKFKQLVLNDKKTVFLLSFAFVAPVVFNQQILTGRSLQPFHYEFFCANYISLFALLMTGFTILEKNLPSLEFKKILVITAAVSILIGSFDTFYGTKSVREMNLWRDEMMPAANRIKYLSNSTEQKIASPKSVVLSFDFSQDDYFDSIDLPALSSQPVLWSPHLSMFPDVNSQENLRRIFQFLYYQNFDKGKLQAKLHSKNKYILLLGLFSADRTSALYTGKIKPVTEEEMNEVVEKYDEFRRNFSTADAASPALSFVLVHKDAPNDFSALDLWYERNEGEEIGKFVLFRVKLRTL